MWSVPFIVSRNMYCTVLSYFGVVYLLYMLYSKLSCVIFVSCLCVLLLVVLCLLL